MIASNTIKAQAKQLGFNLVGITRAQPSPTLDAYRHWIAAGMHGKMGYIARDDRVIRREDLNNIVPDAQTIIMVGLDYRSLAISQAILDDPSRGRIASYAWGLDYHEVMQPQLEEFAEWLAAQQPHTHKVYVDTGAVLERSHAQQAGMGFVGKNTMLIHPQRGSYFFLGEIITTLTVSDYDKPHRETMCGTCTRCLWACPTDAFPEPHVLDARRCISYHTIENKGWIDRELRPDFGNWVFGCDICQEVCPFQRFSQASDETLFYPDEADYAAPLLSDLLTLDEKRFKLRYAGTPIERIKRRGLVRNACIAAGNSEDQSLIPHLIQLLYDTEPLVRGHAAWALWQLMRRGALGLLQQAWDNEDDADVRAEIEALVP